MRNQHAVPNLDKGSKKRRGKHVNYKQSAYADKNKNGAKEYISSVAIPSS
jgi:hypothetical protein